MPENRSFPAGLSPLPAKPRPAPGQRYLWSHSQYKPQDIDLQAQNEISPPISGCCLFPHAAGQPPGCLRRAGRPHPAVDQPAPVLPVGDGLRPAPLGKVPFLHRFPLFRKAPTPRKGGPMCPPVNDSCEGPGSGRHTDRPLQIRLQCPSPPENRAGTPRPCANTGSLPQKRPPQKTGRRASALLPVCACRDLVSYRLLASSTTLWMASAASAGSLLKPPSAVSRPST